MLLPSKLKSGEKFKDTVVKRINEIIDYLKTQRLSGDLKTIKINQNTSGITISALPQNAVGQSSGNGGGGLNDYPFKMKIVTPQLAEGEQPPEKPEYFLQITEGRIQINDNTMNRSYFIYGKDKQLDLSEITQNSYVLLLCNFLPDGTATGENTYFDAVIFFLPEDATTIQAPMTRGVFCIPLGQLKKNEDDDTLSAYNQIIGDFNYDFQALRHPFSVTASVDIVDGEKLDNLDLNRFTFYMAQGEYNFNKSITKVTEETFTVYTDSYVYLSIKKQNDYEIKVESSELDFYDSTTKTYNYLIAKIYEDYNSGVCIQQKINSFVNCGDVDTYKVMVQDDDQQPMYLNQKFDWQSFDQTDYQQTNQYIGAKTRQYQVTVGNVKQKAFNIVPRFLYKNISSYKEDAVQVLQNNKGVLKWGKKSDGDDEQGKIDITVQGSLSDYIEIQSTTDQDQDENKTTTYTFSFKPQDGGISGYSFLTISATGSLQHWTPSAVGTGVITYSNNNPSVIEAPAAAGNVNLYRLTGVGGTVAWTQAEDAADFGKVKTSQGDSYSWIQDKLFSDTGSINVKLMNSQVSLDIQPTYFFSSDDSILFTDMYVGLDCTVPDLGKIKLADDDQLGFLQDKLTSDSGSITTDLSINGNLVSIDIQPSYFMSSDDSITFETVTEHLDLTIPNLGKIKLTDDGQLGFLQDKLIVDSSIASLLKLELVGEQLLIKSAITGSGLLKVENGVVSVLAAPSDKSVLVGDANGFSWMGIAECETACTVQENDDPNIPPVIQE